LSRQIASALIVLAMVVLSAPEAKANPEDIVTKTTESFHFVYRERYGGAVGNTIAVAEKRRSKILDDFGASALMPRVEVRFARNTEEMRSKCPRPPPRWANAVAFWPDNVIVISLTSSQHRPVSLETVFRHELAHIALKWAVKGQRVPRWFSEGLSIWASEELPMDRMKVLWPAAASGQFLPLSRLDRSYPQHEFEVNLAYAQSADLVRYLVVHDGEERLPDLLARVREGESFYDAMEATWGRSVRALEQQWHRDAERRYSAIPSITAGLTFWTIAAGLAIAGYVRRRRDIRRRIAAMPDDTEVEL